MTITEDRVAQWRGKYPDSPPVGWILREREVTSWTRFHNLPDAKRYPESKAEEKIVLGRVNDIASALFGTSQVVVFQQVFSPVEHVSAGVYVPGSSVVSPIPADWLEALDPYFENASALSFVGGAIDWRPGVLDSLLLATALDRVAGPALLAPVSGNLLCPYDGGMDTFLPEPAARRALRERFRAWLPTAATGFIEDLAGIPARSPLRTTEEWDQLAESLGAQKVERRDPVN